MIKLSNHPQYKIEVLTGIAPFDVDYHVEVEKIINGSTRYKLRSAKYASATHYIGSTGHEIGIDYTLVEPGTELWPKIETYILKEIEKGTVQWT